MSRDRAKKDDGWADIKHWKPADFMCRCGSCNSQRHAVSMDVVHALERVRDVVGLPVTVLKSATCKTANDLAGGDPLSGHVVDARTGYASAVDVAIVDATYRYQILKAAIDAGFNRIGLGKNWIHLEIAPQEGKPLLLGVPRNETPQGVIYGVGRVKVRDHRERRQGSFQ